VAALAAKEHGDARKAIDTLYEPGRLAEKQDVETVTVNHVGDAVQRAEVNGSRSCSAGRHPTSIYVLHALALLTADNPEQQTFRTHRASERFTGLVAHDGLEPLSEDRVYRLLKEQSFLGVTESNHTGGGQGEGSYLEHRLLGRPEVVTQALEISDAG